HVGPGQCRRPGHALFVAGVSMARVGMAGMALAETIRVRVRPILGMVLKVHASSTKALAVATAYRLARRRRRARRRPFAPVPVPPLRPPLASMVRKRALTVARGCCPAHLRTWPGSSTWAATPMTVEAAVRSSTLRAVGGRHPRDPRSQLALATNSFKACGGA